MGGTSQSGVDAYRVGAYGVDAYGVDAYGHRPFWRGRLHLAAAVVAAPAVTLLMLRAEGSLARTAAAVYGVSLVGLYAVSAAYHRLARTPAAVLWFRRLDHSMIFVLIAGSYTPLCLLVLPPALGIPLLVAIWAAALGGITMKMVKLGTGPGPNGSWLYLVMGWAAVVTIPALAASLTAPQLALMASGGVLYTLGAIVLWRRWPNPAPDTFGYHEVWHAMTIAAGGCHFALMALIV